MMRSLWSGVSGLQAHQIAMDVEGNNIANVNTTGFKYSRANFADMLSQNPSIATAPQGELGGQNATQIGLGTTIDSTTRIFSQGTLKTTDNNKDLAIQGNGFFIVSPDGGKTDLYTRNGEFLFDRAGNYVNSSGYIVQGWTRDEETGAIDSTGPIGNIVIKQGLTTPARATTMVNIKANLDSGNSIGSRSTPIYSLDSYNLGRDSNTDGAIFGTSEIHNENDKNSNQFYTNAKNEQILTERGVDLSVIFNKDGNAVALREGQGLWVSYANATTKPYSVGSGNAADIGKLRAGSVLDITLNGVAIKSNTITSISDVASLINAQYNTTGVRAEISAGNQLTLINRNNSGTTAQSKNVHLVKNAADNTGLESIDVVTAYQYVYTSTATTPIHDANDRVARKINTTEDLRAAMQKDARFYVDYDGDGSLETSQALAASNATDAFANGGLAAAKASLTAANPALEAAYTNAITVANNAATAAGIVLTEAQQHLAGVKALNAMSADANDGVTFTVNKQGQFQLENPADGVADQALYISITGLTSQATGTEQAVNENVRLTTIMASLEGSLSPSRAIRTSSEMVMSSHGSTIEIFDSLGSKHTVSVKWAKVGTTLDGGTEWNMVIQVPEPAEINFSGEGPANVITGSLRFDSKGALSSYNPASFTFTANNGSASGQSVRLDFGLNSENGGLTSFDRDSSTEYVTQDGYEGGILQDVKIDETGTIIGAFSNGKSFGLAKVALATFTNNEGLVAEGGNVFSASANSGEAVVGSAGMGSKGGVAAAKLEQSNVDLSRALTQLIVIQRGYQANSKTITTSDEMLNTLLQLKN
ncbi:flagellar hook protein FlgE [Campylobacter sp. 9BO]|uniref:flagellar hook protein FlgE n=1 Tax=Campylobacter sp. 9BO TaxID=3424759 RepID=UPI003D32961E